MTWTGPAHAALEVGEVKLCRVVQGDGVCRPQPHDRFAPGSRLWARVELSGVDPAAERVDLQLQLEVIDTQGQVAHRETVIDGRRAVPPGPVPPHAVVAYAIPPTTEPGEHRLRLALTDREANLRAITEKSFAVGVLERVAAELPLRLAGRSRAVSVTVHGVRLADDVGGQLAPEGQLFLLVETTWHGLLPESAYRADLAKLAGVSVDGALTYPFTDLGRFLADALPQPLTVGAGGRLRGWLAFVVPAELTSAVLQFHDDIVGRSKIELPLFDLARGDALTVPPPGTGGPPIIPPGGAGPATLQESEPNNSGRSPTELPAGRRLTVEGTLQTATDQDWYRLNVETEEPSSWEVAVSGIPGVNLTLEVWTAGGQRTLIDAGGEGQAERIHHLGLAPGAHLLAVHSRGGAKGGERYTLTARLAGRVRPGEEAELNNRREAANVLQVAEAVSGWIGFPRDTDFYRLEVDRQATFALSLTAPKGSEMNLWLRDEGGRELGRYSLEGGQLTEQQPVRLDRGVYYLEVGGTPDPTRRYTLVAMPLRGEGLNQDLEDNGGPESATPVSAGAHLDGSFQSRDEDWFVVDNDTGREQVLKALIRGARSAEVGLFDAARRRLDTSRPRATYVHARVPPGLSYVRAMGVNARYRLRVWLDPPAPVTDPRTAARLGLNSLVSAALDWQAEHRCYGCHVQAMAVVGGSLGIDNGYDVPRDALAELVSFMQQQQTRTDVGELTAQLLHGVGQSYYEELVVPGDAPASDAMALTADLLGREQLDDGSWTHSRVEPPVHLGDIQATADALHVLRRMAGDWHERIERGVTFLSSAEPVTTQDLVYHILGLTGSREPGAQSLVARSLSELMARQNDNGGWSEAAGLDSSPYATGQALFALKTAGASVRDPAFRRGVSWLLETQTHSGQWKPQGASNSDARPSLFPPTMWATIGLAGTFQTVDVEIASPLPGEVAAGNVRIVAEVDSSSVTPVDRVLFHIGDEIVCMDEFAPFECDWTAPEQPEAHLIRVTATDTAGRSGYDTLLTALPLGDGTIRVVAAETAAPPVPSHIEIVLDASGSMNAMLDGRPRIQIARKVLADLLTDLPDDVDVALRVYGHRHYYKDRVCTDSELLVPFGGVDRRSIIARIEEIRPQGMTPIGYSLQQVARDLASVPGRPVVVLISDGEETCGADPCQVIRELVESGLDLQTHVVGYAIDDDVTAGQLACIAAAGSGHYLPAGDAGQLGAALQQAVSATFVVLAANGVEVARGAVDGEPVTVPVGRYSVQLQSESSAALTNVPVRVGRETLLTLEAGNRLESAP